MAFFTNKLLSPLRMACTVAITPPLAKHLARRGHTWFLRGAKS